VETQPPQSPDFNILDELVFPWLDKKVAKLNRNNLDMDKLVKHVATAWKDLRPEAITRGFRHISENLRRSRGEGGGNEYIDKKRPAK
jgi:hypothetical protein